MLTMDLELLRREVPLGGEIPLRATLRNASTAALETASLFDNNQITNYAILDGRGRLIKTVNHVTRQLLMGRGEPRTTDHRLMTLAAGAAEVREDNLCRYEWFERPGSYFVQAFHRWAGAEVRSAPQPLDILPAPLHAFDQQWVYHYRERFQLQSAWVAELPDGSFELYLRESLRSRPTVINHNPSLGLWPKPIHPRVSFNRSLMAGDSVWLSWLGEGTVSTLKIVGGKPVTTPQELPLGLRELDWVGAPQMSGAGDLVMFLSAQRPAGGRLVVALQVAPDGREARRAVAVEQLQGAVALYGLCDEEDVFHLLWLDGETRSLWHQPISLATLQCLADPVRLWHVAGAPLAVLSPPVLTDEGYLGCLYRPEGSGADVLGMAWLQLDADANPLKSETIPLPGLEGLTRCTGEITTGGRLFALLATGQGLVYVNGALAQSRVVARPEDCYPTGPELLTINSKNDVFLVANRVGLGLSETLLQDSQSEDLSEGGSS